MNLNTSRSKRIDEPRRQQAAVRGAPPPGGGRFDDIAKHPLGMSRRSLRHIGRIAKHTCTRRRSPQGAGYPLGMGTRCKALMRDPEASSSEIFFQRIVPTEGLRNGRLFVPLLFLRNKQPLGLRGVKPRRPQVAIGYIGTIGCRCKLPSAMRVLRHQVAVRHIGRIAKHPRGMSHRHTYLRCSRTTRVVDAVFFCAAGGSTARTPHRRHEFAVPLLCE